MIKTVLTPPSAMWRASSIFRTFASKFATKVVCRLSFKRWRTVWMVIKYMGIRGRVIPLLIIGPDSNLDRRWPICCRFVKVNSCRNGIRTRCLSRSPRNVVVIYCGERPRMVRARSALCTISGYCCLFNFLSS